MTGYQILYLISLVTYTFGALTFSVLAVTWAVRGKRTFRSLTAFTAVCAAAFVLNLALSALNLLSPEWGGAEALEWVAAVATGLLPALWLHVVWQQEESGLPLRPWWRAGLVLLYVSCGAGALLRQSGPESLADMLEDLPAAHLAVAGAAGLAATFLSRRAPGPQEVRQRWWYRAILGLTLVSAAFGWSQAADYLLLAFFAVTLYYRERLVFFDLLLKRGAFFAVALAGLTFFFATAPAGRLPGDWSRPWLFALLIMPLWLASPWLYGVLARVIDRYWLGRPYSAAEAERQFARAVQAAGTENELRAVAEASLREIFRTEARVRFGGGNEGPGDGLAAPLAEEKGAGQVVLEPRRNAAPFLSDDERLLRSLARTLGVVRENVRFREEQRRQEERERELRLLASRAELRALRAQINPHFLFNALNAIAGLIPENPALADETVEQLAQVFRYTLRKSEKEWARLDDEVEFAQAYLRVEQARFGARMQVEFDVEPAAEPVPIPAMTIQPLIENAVKHGVGAVAGPARVRLRARVIDGVLSIEVFDSGPGFRPEMRLDANGGGGHGLRNVAERLRGYYGESARLWWENGSDGTHVFLTIPRQGAARA
jgi:hypothetical protein